DLDGAAAGETDLPGLLVTQVELEQARLVGGDDGGRLLDHLGVDAAADGDGAEDAPSLPHEHLGAFLPGRGPARVHQGGQSHLASRVAQPVEMLEELGRHTVTSG